MQNFIFNDIFIFISPDGTYRLITSFVIYILYFFEFFSLVFITFIWSRRGHSIHVMIAFPGHFLLFLKSWWKVIIWVLFVFGWSVRIWMSLPFLIEAEFHLHIVRMTRTFLLWYHVKWTFFGTLSFLLIWSLSIPILCVWVDFIFCLVLCFLPKV